jgi:hypothetical protein
MIEMSRFKLSFTYVAIAVLSLLGPLFIKELATGSSGLNTMLVAGLVTGPSGFLLLGFALGGFALRLHVLLFVLSNAIAFASWYSSDINPWKDLAGAYISTFSLAFLSALLIQVFKDSLIGLIRAMGLNLD